jgi:hypothetical protein
VSAAVAIPPSTVLTEIVAGLGLSFSQAARRFPSARRGRPVHSSCVWRWAREGVRLPGGRVVRLECAKVSGRWLTSEPALERFIAAQTPTPDMASSPAVPRTPAARRRDNERAAAELEKAGI